MGWTIYQSHRIHVTGIFIYMYHKNQPNVGNYNIHGSYGNVEFLHLREGEFNRF